jgi:hypothetical protein
VFNVNDAAEEIHGQLICYLGLIFYSLIYGMVTFLARCVLVGLEARRLPGSFTPIRKSNLKCKK